MLFLPERSGKLLRAQRNPGLPADGAFSDYVVMPLERIYDGKGLPARTLALIEPFCIFCYHGVKRADEGQGTRCW